MKKQTRLIIGLIINIGLALLKLVAAYFSKSVALQADGLNNLGDALSSISSNVSVYYAKKPPDKKHPFGYARAEYLASFFLGVMISAVAIDVLESALKGLIKNGSPDLGPLAVGVTLFGIIAKFILWIIYKQPLKKEELSIDQSGDTLMQAAAADSISDVLTSSAVLLSFFLERVYPWRWDSIIGLIVFFAILKSAYRVLQNSTNKIIGEKLDKALRSEVCSLIEATPGILGCHDIIIHSYGGRTIFITAHVEVPETMGIRKAHEAVDGLERKLALQFKAQAMLHIDPVQELDAEGKELKAICEKAVREVRHDCGYKPEKHSEHGRSHPLHDFRIIEEGQEVKVYFDVSLCRESSLSPEEYRNEIIKKIGEHFKAPAEIIINVDTEYLQHTAEA